MTIDHATSCSHDPLVMSLMTNNLASFHGYQLSDLKRSCDQLKIFKMCQGSHLYKLNVHYVMSMVMTNGASCQHIDVML